MEDKRLFKGKKKQYMKISNKEKSIKRTNSKNKRKILFYSFAFFLFTFMIICTTTFINRKSNLSRATKIKNIETKIAILKYLTNDNKTLYEGAQKCRDIHDGSYVMLDDFENIKIAYSIGIDGEIQFDKALADKGIDVYMYDHTIYRLPYENEKFHWKKIGIGGMSDRSNNIQTLTDMMKDNGHLNEKNMILKIDVEGPEWKALNDISEDVLKQFKYILIEYHFFQIYPELFYKVLKKIYKTHQAFYVHCCADENMKTFGNNRICVAIEVSYIIRSGYSFAKDKSIYPIQGLAYHNHKGFNVNILKLFDDYN